MKNRRHMAPFWVPLLFGLLSLANVIGRPGIGSIRLVDLLQLLATGMCFGAALVTFVQFMRGTGST